MLKLFCYETNISIIILSNLLCNCKNTFNKWKSRNERYFIYLHFLCWTIFENVSKRFNGRCSKSRGSKRFDGSTSQYGQRYKKWPLIFRDSGLWFDVLMIRVHLFIFVSLSICLAILNALKTQYVFYTILAICVTRFVFLTIIINNQISNIKY